MDLSHIVSVLNEVDVPIHILSTSELQNKKYCYAVVIPTDKLSSFRGTPSSNSAKETGVYIIDCDLDVFYEANKSTNFEGVVQIEKIIKDNFDILETEYVISFALFSILHEVGHIRHLQNSKLSYEEYYDTYQRTWDNIYRNYLFMYNLYGTTPERKKAVNQLFGEEYRQHAFESYADSFAIEHFEKYMCKLRNMIK